MVNQKARLGAQVISATFLLAFLFAPSAAHACSCGAPDLKTPKAKQAYVSRQVEAAAAVFLGEVVAIDQFQVQFRVEKVWKGNIARSITLGTGTGMEPGNVQLTNTCTLDFRGSAGQSYVVFADADRFGRLSAHRCGPTMPVSYATDTLAALNTLSQPRGPVERVPSRRHPELAEIFGAVLDAMDLDPDEEVFAGKHLDPTSREAVTALLGRELREVPTDPLLRVPANGVVVEWLTATEKTGHVIVTLGPVPLAWEVRCGVTLAVPLSRMQKRWTATAETPAACANPTRGHPEAAPNRLTDVLRLAMTAISGEGPAPRLLSGPTLSVEAREVLAQFGPVIDADKLETPEFRVPAGHFKLTTLSADGATALVEGVTGPVPQANNGGCGTGHTIRFKRQAGGWAVQHVTTVC